MSSQRSRSRTVKSPIIIALSAPVIAVTAIALGGLSAPALAQPVSSAQVVSVTGAASALTLRVSSVAAASDRRLSAVHVSAVTTRRRHHHLMAPRQIAWTIMHWFGWKAKWQFRYLNWLWERESSWNRFAVNPYSGAYGIPQAVPAYKMASVGSDWRWSARTQIRWGMRYIKATYGTPKRAWEHEVNYGWY